MPLSRTIEVYPTPIEVANCFWRMTDVEQAAVFTEMAKVIKAFETKHPSSYNFAEKQWLAMTNRIKEEGGDTLALFTSFVGFLDYSE